VPVLLSTGQRTPEAVRATRAAWRRSDRDATPWPLRGEVVQSSDLLVRFFRATRPNLVVGGNGRCPFGIICRGHNRVIATRPPYHGRLRNRSVLVSRRPEDRSKYKLSFARQASSNCPTFSRTLSRSSRRKGRETVVDADFLQLYPPRVKARPPG